MNPAKWQKLEEIYDQALALKPDDRESFCVRACGNDSEILNELEKMFNGHAHAIENSFLDHAAWRINSSNMKEGEMIGEIIDGKYEIVDSIGEESGMGDVYLAVWKIEGRDTRKVVVKFAKDHLGENALIRFRDEMQILATLDHDNIAKIYDAGKYNNRPYFVMEHLKGESLSHFIAARNNGSGGIDLKLIGEITAQACAGLQYVHENKIWHRDIKPDNLMILNMNGKMRVKVIDFGIAKFPEGITRHATSMPIGTPAYMSPEQRDLDKYLQADWRTDIYSMGLVIYEMLTGKPVYKQVDYNDFINNRIPAPSGVNAKVAQVVMKALKTDPDRRQQSIKDLADELDAAIIGAQESAKSVDPRPIARPNHYRQKVLIAASILALIVVAAIASQYWSGIIGGGTVDPPVTSSITATLPKIEPPKMDIYLRGAANGPGEIVKDKVFTSDEKLRFTVTPPADGYIYLVQRGSREDLTLIYPDSRIKNTDNSVRGGMPVLFPPAGTSGKPVWFNFDNEPGIETVYGVFVKDKSDKIAGAIEEGIRRNRRSPLNQLLLDEGIEVLLQSEIEKPSSNSVSVSKLVFNHK